MELHSPAVGKKLWNYLKVAFFMMRKGLISKRKLIMDLNLAMKRGKLMGKSLGKNLVFHHHHFSRSAPPRGFGYGLGEYEFSCSNSPIPVFPNVGSTSKRRHNYFPCINAGTDEADEADEAVGTPGPAVVTPRIEYSPQCSYLSYDLAPGEMLSPLPSPAPFSIRVSNYSSDEEGEEATGGKVDDEAEEFIRRFYEQLRAQSRMRLLEYQEREYQEMLARGT